jgi:hypothetical protein
MVEIWYADPRYPRAEHFQAIASGLYGERWYMKLAAIFGMDERTIRRYASGELPVKHCVWLALLLLAASHRTAKLDSSEGVAMKRLLSKIEEDIDNVSA